MTKTVPCPGCGVDTAWSTDNPHRPFCSKRCKDSDFIAWADEKQVIPGSPVYDEILSESLNDPNKH